MYEKIGPVEIIGDHRCKIPFSASLLIRGTEETVMIDCGPGFESISEIRQSGPVDQIVLTHHHIDHTWGVKYFPEAKVLINEGDAHKSSDMLAVSLADGMYAVLGETAFDDWMNEQSDRHFGTVSVGDRRFRTDGTYPTDKDISMGGINIRLLHAPGHTEGYTVPYIEKYGIAYVGDFDLTSFGPFYNELESSIEDFIQSAEMTVRLDAKYYVTGHHKGIVARDEYRKMMARYLEIIHKRDERILGCIKNGVQPRDLILQNIFYLKEQIGNSVLRIKNETIGIYKHLLRLAAAGEPIHDYLDDFIRSCVARPEYLQYPPEGGNLNEQTLEKSIPTRHSYRG